MIVVRSNAGGGIAGVVVAAAALFLTSCSTSSAAGTDMTPDEALSEVVTLVESAQDVIGGDWKNDDTGAFICALPDGRSGATHSILRLGRGVSLGQQRDVLDRITKDWTRRGHPPIRSKRPVIRGITVTRLVIESTSSEDAGLFIEVDVADTGSSITADSRCINAEPYEVNGVDDADLFDGY